MNEDVINAMLIRNLQRSATTPTTPVNPNDINAGTTDVDDPVLEEVVFGRAIAQARAANEAAEAKLHGQRAQLPPVVARTARLTGLLTMRSLNSENPKRFHFSFIGAAASASNVDVTRRVKRYAERAWLGPYGGACWGALGATYLEPIGVFSLEAAAPPAEWHEAPVAFERAEPVEQNDARALRLFGSLQNGAALGRASVERLRYLRDSAYEEGQSFSLDALDALVVFANTHPTMPQPELTLSPSGGIIAEWRRAAYSVTLYFVNLVHVQYLVKQPNPLHRDLGERSSGMTTVDRVGVTLRALVPDAAWPIRA